jgi:hypothetical protein
MEMAWAMDYANETHPGFLWVAGKFVEADKPNLNKQFWSTEDLEFGQHTIKFTPMNMLHKIYDPIGVYVESRFVPASDTDNAHIEALGCVWAYRYPKEAEQIEKADTDGTLWFSMECVGEKLHCKGGCEKEFAYFTPRQDLCEHLRERTSVRHIVNPYFTGGAIIIPPAKPAWPNADVEVQGDDSQEKARAQHWNAIMDMLLSMKHGKN